MNQTEVENKGIDERLFHVLCTVFRKAPSHHTMGMNLIYLGQGLVGIKMSVGHEYTTVPSRLHGGIIAALADTAMAWSMASLGHSSITVEMSLNYFAPAFKGTELIAEGYVINAGKTITVVEASVFNNKGKLIAKSKGTFIKDNTSWKSVLADMERA